MLDSEPPRLYRDLAEDWQETDFAALDPAWLRLAGQSVEVPHQRAYLERPRGHSKTSDIAMSAVWALAFSQRMLAGVAAAGDLDQARLLVDAMRRLVAVNPWLGAFITFQRNAVEAPRTGSRLDVITADVGTSWGLRPDFIVADEVSVWSKPDLWYSLFSAAAKRSRCILLLIGNAGFGQDWRWELREQARSDPAWYFHSLDGPQARWISAGTLDEQRRLLPPGVFARLWLNRWSADGGDFVTLAECQACRDPALAYRSRGQPGVRYVAAVDYGERRDRTVAVVCHRAGDAVVVDRMDVWQPEPGQPVDVASVEGWMDEVQAAFGSPLFVLDPWQMAGTDQRFTAKGFRVERWNATGKSQANLAQVLLGLIVNRRVRWYAGAGRCGDGDLERELAALVVKPTAAGWRFDHAANNHDDRAVALGMACVTVMEQPAPAHLSPRSGGRRPELDARPFAGQLPRWVFPSRLY